MNCSRRYGVQNKISTMDPRALALWNQIRDCVPYLKKRLEQIKEKNEEQLRQDDVGNIHYWLEIAHEVRADMVYGIETLEVSYEQITEMSRQFPIPGLFSNDEEDDFEMDVDHGMDSEDSRGLGSSLSGPAAGEFIFEPKVPVCRGRGIRPSSNSSEVPCPGTQEHSTRGVFGAQSLSSHESWQPNPVGRGRGRRPDLKDPSPSPLIPESEVRNGLPHIPHHCNADYPNDSHPPPRGRYQAGSSDNLPIYNSNHPYSPPRCREGTLRRDEFHLRQSAGRHEDERQYNNHRTSPTRIRLESFHSHNSSTQIQSEVNPDNLGGQQRYSASHQNDESRYNNFIRTSPSRSSCHNENKRPTPGSNNPFHGNRSTEPSQQHRSDLRNPYAFRDGHQHTGNPRIMQDQVEPPRLQHQDAILHHHENYQTPRVQTFGPNGPPPIQNVGPVPAQAFGPNIPTSFSPLQQQVTQQNMHQNYQPGVNAPSHTQLRAPYFPDGFAGHPNVPQPNLHPVTGFQTNACRPPSSLNDGNKSACSSGPANHRQNQEGSHSRSNHPPQGNCHQPHTLPGGIDHAEWRKRCEEYFRKKPHHLRSVPLHNPHAKNPRSRIVSRDKSNTRCSGQRINSGPRGPTNNDTITQSSEKTAVPQQSPPNKEKEEILGRVRASLEKESPSKPKESKLSRLRKSFAHGECHRLGGTKTKNNTIQKGPVEKLPEKPAEETVTEPTKESKRSKSRDPSDSRKAATKDMLVPEDGENGEVLQKHGEHKEDQLASAAPDKRVNRSDKIPYEEEGETKKPSVEDGHESEGEGVKYQDSTDKSEISEHDLLISLVRKMLEESGHAEDAISRILDSQDQLTEIMNLMREVCSKQTGDLHTDTTGSEPQREPLTGSPADPRKSPSSCSSSAAVAETSAANTVMKKRKIPEKSVASPSSSSPKKIKLVTKGPIAPVRTDVYVKKTKPSASTQVIKKVKDRSRSKIDVLKGTTLPINTGPIKIKIEKDYVPLTRVKTEPRENHDYPYNDDFDPNFS